MDELIATTLMLLGIGVHALGYIGQCEKVDTRSSTLLRRIGDGMMALGALAWMLIGASALA